MSIQFNCSGCGATHRVSDKLAGKKAKCNRCHAVFQVPVTSHKKTSPPPIPKKPSAPQQVQGHSVPPKVPEVAAVTPGPPQPSQLINAGLQSMKCKSCGGNVEYSSGQGYLECKYCHSRYNAVTDAQGQSVIQTIELRELKKEMQGVKGELQVNRLQEKAELVQDKLDYKFVEFHHSFARKAGTGAVICWVLGGIILLFGSDAGFGAVVVGVGVIGLGLGLFFLVFKKAQAVFRLEHEEIRSSQLEPIFVSLRKVGATLEGGDVALGYTESTKIPMKYCVSCHKNVTPDKGRGGGHSLWGAHMFLIIFTCGMWIPAALFIEMLAKAGTMAQRSVMKGACPICGTTPLFPARVKDV